MRFENSVNGSPVCTAGQDGFGVLCAILSWRNIDVQTFSPEERQNLSANWRPTELLFSVSGIEGAKGPHTCWKVPRLTEGDVISIRLLSEGSFDPPMANSDL